MRRAVKKQWSSSWAACAVDCYIFLLIGCSDERSGWHFGKVNTYSFTWYIQRFRIWLEPCTIWSHAWRLGCESCEKSSKSRAAEPFSRTCFDVALWLIYGSGCRLQYMLWRPALHVIEPSNAYSGTCKAAYARTKSIQHWKKQQKQSSRALFTHLLHSSLLSALLIHT